MIGLGNLKKIILVGMVFLYSYVQYLSFHPVFFEIQFLQEGLLKALVNNDLKASDFVAVFGEHLFSGYSALYAINYYLFNISLWFDFVVSFVIVILSALVSFYIFRKNLINSSVLGFAVSVLALLSPILNASMSMSLAASISVFLLLIINCILTSRKYFNIALILLPLYGLFFAGAYFVGFFGSLVFILLNANLKNVQKVSLLFVSVLTLVIYFLILTSFTSPNVSK